MSSLPSFEGLFTGIAWLLIVFVPLGLWKAVDILIWITHHIHIHLS